MKYFLDTEFIEGPQKRTFLGFNIGETKPTIDLISIGIVAEDGREYYAISKDFNLKEAWNRYDEKIVKVDYGFNTKSETKKVYWLRENVLYPIFAELYKKENQFTWNEEFGNIGNFMLHMERSGKAFDLFQRLILRYGKNNIQITKEIKTFCHFWNTLDSGRTLQNHPIEFYAYYCSYDWVVFCWLFGKMIDLPKGFPMYCNDIEQIKVATVKRYCDSEIRSSSFDSALERFKKHPDYPKQEASKKHHALEDARYDRDLYNFLNCLPTLNLANQSLRTVPGAKAS